MIKWKLFFLLICIPFSGFCQKDTLKKSPRAFVSVFTNATAMPFSGKLGIINTPVHPGISGGIELPLNKSLKNQFYQTIRVGAFYHQFAQTGVQVYSETGFRRMFGKVFFADIRLGAGGMLAFPNTKIFKLENGSYKKIANTGRPQFMASTLFGPGANLERFNLPFSIFLHYQFWLQLPFVNEYIPVLPNAALHLGISWNL